MRLLNGGAGSFFHFLAAARFDNPKAQPIVGVAGRARSSPDQKARPFHAEQTPLGRGVVHRAKEGSKELQGDPPSPFFFPRLTSPTTHPTTPLLLHSLLGPLVACGFAPDTPIPDAALRIIPEGETIRGEQGTAMAKGMDEDLDQKVCYCFHVTRRKLLNFLRIERPRVASQLSQCGGAGTGCGWCIPFLKQLYQQSRAGGETELDRLTPEEYARRRAAYIRAGGGTPPPGATPLPDEETTAE
jgi:bacterioferritin-associated ferredoxin